MQQFSEYAGPSDDDYANVLALNTMFIQAVCDLKGPQRGRLAATPFLLFSLREQDLGWWQGALIEQRQCSLMTAANEQRPQLQKIQTAALSFLWQLAHQNPYAARLVSGAAIAWCDYIRSFPLVTLLDRASTREDLVVSRLECGSVTGDRLLGTGVSSNVTVRRSTQLVALQSLITQSNDETSAHLPAAACSMTVPIRVRVKNV